MIYAYKIEIQLIDSGSSQALSWKRRFDMSKTAAGMAASK